MSTGAMTQVSWPELGAIIGKDNLHGATAADAVDGVSPQTVCEPGTAEELARALQWAHEAGLKVAPRGGGTKLDWGNPPVACDMVLSTTRLNRVLEHAWADMTVIVEAGCRVADLQNKLAQHGQRLALDPLWPEQATIGGILSTNDSGTLRARYGSLRDLIIGVTVALPDGTLAMSGGRVVKNVAGYDLSKLFTGALGTLGVIVQAVFRLYPLPRQSRSLTFSGSPETLNRLLLDITSSKLTFTGLQLRANPAGANLDVRFDGTVAGVQTQVDQAQQIAAPLSSIETELATWTAHQAIWADSSSALVVKVNLLPSHFSELCDALASTAASSSLDRKMVMQSVGTGYVRLAGNDSALRNALLTLRHEVAKLGGTTVALRCPLALKRGLDIWGPPTDAQALMLRIKQRFDPDGTLNPGRFLGGI